MRKQHRMLMSECLSPIKYLLLSVCVVILWFLQCSVNGKIVEKFGTEARYERSSKVRCCRVSQSCSGRQFWLVWTQHIHHQAEGATATRDTVEQVVGAHHRLVWEMNRLCGGSGFLRKDLMMSRSCGRRSSPCWRPVNDTIKRTLSPLLLFFQGDSSWGVLASITSAN